MSGPLHLERQFHPKMLGGGFIESGTRRPRLEVLDELHGAGYDLVTTTSVGEYGKYIIDTFRRRAGA